MSDVHTPWSIYYDKMQGALSVLPLLKIYGYVFVALTSKKHQISISPPFSRSALSQMQVIRLFKAPSILDFHLIRILQPDGGSSSSSIMTSFSAFSSQLDNVWISPN